MISHAQCDHESTSKARAKCRREKGLVKKKEGGATPRSLDFSKTRTRDEDDNYGQCPSRREDECHVCHVEWISHKGTDAWTGLTVYVGSKCMWRLKKTEPITTVIY
jgi:hypothetical protein